jgi:hypothetical protein
MNSAIAIISVPLMESEIMDILFFFLFTLRLFSARLFGVILFKVLWHFWSLASTYFIASIGEILAKIFVGFCRERLITHFIKRPEASAITMSSRIHVPDESNIPINNASSIPTGIHRIAKMFP